MRAAAEPDDERAAWLRLLLTDGVGPVAARRLLATFGSAAAVFDARPAAWREVVGAAAAAALGRTPPDLATRIAATETWLAGGPDRAVWTVGDPTYPALLLELTDPPLLLFARGDPRWLQGSALAVVGSRNPTAQGVDSARAFARTLSDAGFVVVSGLALGIDAAAHEGALDGASGTIAVVGTGPDRVYPARHHALAHRIAQRGLILSEFVPGAPPLPEHFPRRNRVIAGLARGTLVVEAALRSGSLITARLAAEAGREVFAIPGSIHSPQSRGCHQLIRQGAKLVESAQDILEELAPAMARSGAPLDEPGDDNAPAERDPLLAALGHEPVTLDALSARTGWSAQALNVKLLELELDGRVARLPGGLFQRRGHA
ncbi:MAG: DNA-processing protein DprA [Rubrivivax sp.]